MTLVKDILSAKPAGVYAVAPTDSVSHALALLREHVIGALMVLDVGELVGIVSERDCAIRIALPGLDAREVRVADIMTRNVITIDPLQRLEKCMSEMTQRDIRHLPVVDAGRVIGMVSIGDVVKAMLREQRQHIDYLEAYIKGHANPYA